MGSGLKLYCPSCGFSEIFSLGVGFSYPRVFVDTNERARSGRFGSKLKNQLKKHPEAVVDPTVKLTHCPRCHQLGSEMDLTAYVPKPGYDRSKEPKRVWSSVSRYNDLDYVSPSDFLVHYDVLSEYDHSCEKCGAKLELIDSSSLTMDHREIPCRK